MQSFKSDIQKQIDTIPEGKIFTFSELVFPRTKFANVAVILSNLAKTNKLARIEKGAYYKPKQSNLGLGTLPVYQDEQLNYLTNKLNGYVTGGYIYNKMSLTEQVPAIITIAVHYPVRAFKFKKLSVECVKAYVDTPNDNETLFLVRILDAIKDIKHIPGTSPQSAYDKIFNLHILSLASPSLKKLVSLSTHYPPRVRKVLSDMLYKNNKNDLADRLVGTICPTTHFNLSYQTA
ncbi:hypothetical protein FACS1894162_3360 [Bacteroidia bacterium]|nr:hypothetical protein FACS1894162_3360 [Bacteroidia bacterium]